MADLERQYKTRLDHSHQAGLEAVYELGLEQGRESEAREVRRLEHEVKRLEAEIQKLEHPPATFNAPGPVTMTRAPK